MSVFRVEKNSNYTVISNYHLRDKNLSLRTIGLLSLILSLPDSWDYSQAGLTAIVKDGEDSVRSGLKELEKFGYLERERERDENGRMKGVVYHVYETPKEQRDKTNTTTTHGKKKSEKKSPKSEEPGLGSPIWENPMLVNPEEANPELDKQAQINTDVSSKDLSSTELNNPSIYQSKEDDGLMDGFNRRNAYEELIRENVGYEVFVRKIQSLNEKLDNGEIDIFDYDRETMVYNIKTVDKIIDYMLDILTSLSHEPISIGGELFNREIVKSKLLKIDFLKLKKVAFEINTNPDIKNPKKYAISMLYNA